METRSVNHSLLQVKESNVMCEIKVDERGGFRTPIPMNFELFDTS